MSHSGPEAGLPGAYAILLAETVARREVSAEDLLSPSGLSLEALARPDARITLELVEELVERALRLTGDPALAVSAGIHMRLSSHGYLGFAAMTASTAREALELAIRFAPTRTKALGLALHVDGGRAALIIDERAPLGRAQEFVLTTLVIGIANLAVDLTGQAIIGEADLVFDEPSYFARVASVMPGRFRFGQPVNRINFDAAYLDLPLRSADSTAMNLAIEQCERQLAELGDEARVLAEITALLALPSGFRKLEEVARELHISTRTLKRRLAERGTSFSTLLDAQRRERSLLLLRDPNLSLDQIAERIGYSDVANFTRAFRRWTGKTPGAVRRA